MRTAVRIVWILVIAGAGVLAVWQPAWFQHALIRQLAARIQSSTPYSMRIGSLTWNIFRGIRLQSVSVVDKATEHPLLEVDEIRVRLDSADLLHRHIHVRRLVILRPRIHYVLSSESKPAQRSTSSLGVFPVDHVEVRDGSVTITRTAGARDNGLTFHSIDMDGHLNPTEARLDHFKLGFHQGSLEGRGQGSWNGAAAWRLQMQSTDFPLHSLAPLGEAHPPVRLLYDGQIDIWGSREKLTVRSHGRLGGAPWTMAGTYAFQSGYSALIDWEAADAGIVAPHSALGHSRITARLHVTGRGAYPNASGLIQLERPSATGGQSERVAATIDWSRGAGPIAIRGSVADNTILFNGRADVPRRRFDGDYAIQLSSPSVLDARLSGLAGQIGIRGHAAWSSAGLTLSGDGQASAIRFHGHSIRSLQAHFAMDPRGNDISLTLQEVRWQPDVTQPWDCTAIHSHLQGTLDRLDTDSTFGFRNHATLRIAGRVDRGPEGWTAALPSLLMDVPSGGRWQSNAPIRCTSQRSHGACQDIDLIHDRDRIALRHVTWAAHVLRGELSIDADPSEWNALWPGKISQDSRLNVHAVIGGMWPNLRVTGSFETHAERVTIDPLHLTLRRLDCRLNSSDHTFSVSQCQALTPHGRVAITGSGTWPQLRFDLNADHLPIRYEKSITATADAALQLTGTLAAPDLKGRIHLHDATYTPPPKPKSKSAAPASAAPGRIWIQSALDVEVDWPRDVWYRDGPSAVETQGNLHLAKSPGQDSIHLTGTINSVRGNYSYLGRSFSIDSAHLLFIGNPGFDPVMNVEASYPAEAVTVYLDLTGTLDKPDLKLRSNPPLSQQDIISVVAFGRPVSDLRSSSNGVTGNQQMEAAAGSVLGNYVGTELRNTGVAPLQFDVFDVQSTSLGNQLTVGRYITRKLFISYGQTLATSTNKAFDADYFLTPRWILEAETGTTYGNHLDLLFRYPLNGGRTDMGSNRLKSPFRNSLDNPLPPNQMMMPAQ